MTIWNINIFKFLTACLIIFFWLTFMSGTVFAQNNNLVVAVVPFEEERELVYLHSRSTHPMDYFIGDNVLSPVYLGMFTNEQISELEMTGYKPEIIDTNPGDLKQYYVAYSINSDNPVSILEGKPDFEVTKQLSDNTMILKIPSGRDIRNLPSIDLRIFEVKRYSFDLVLAESVKELAVQNSPTQTEQAPDAMNMPAETEGMSVKTLSIVVLLIGAVIITFYIFKRNHKKNKPDTT